MTAVFFFSFFGFEGWVGVVEKIIRVGGLWSSCWVNWRHVSSFFVICSGMHATRDSNSTLPFVFATIASCV